MSDFSPSSEIKVNFFLGMTARAIGNHLFRVELLAYACLSGCSKTPLCLGSAESSGDFLSLDLTQHRKYGALSED